MYRNLERTIWIFTIVIMAFGLLAIYSASFQNSRVDQGVFYDQLFCAGIGILFMFFLTHFNYHRLFDAAYIFYGLNIALLFFVLFMGRHILGAKRWIEIGSINFQPSEVTKLVMILVLARYFSQRTVPFRFRRHDSTGGLLREFLFPLFLTGLPMLLVFKQPDLGTAILLFIIFLAITFASGVKVKYLFSLFLFALAVSPVLWKLMKPYQKERLMVFLNPNADPLGAGYTIIQSKIAVGSGMLLGKGWLSGTQNQLNFLPERHTDFIFSVIGEEWGFLGSLFLIFCFFILVNCGLHIVQQTKDRFGFLLGIGIVSILALQVVINIGMVIGFFPVVGLTLPLVSYGRTSFLTFVIMVGLLLNLNRRLGKT